LVARRPTRTNLETASELERDAVEEEATTTPRRAPNEDIDTEPYQTPVALTPAYRKNKARVMAEPEDVPSDVETVEGSDIEVIRLKDFVDKKERKALIRADDRVCTIFRG
jgi:hypothetical protein